ncbi:NAD(P)-dependent dehydrogenase, short-chain alcohol dehydrogenase family [Mesorhizobium muleiense]|uniref:NAD(P)-dependent dehydrogenase, short-chain alcohol dehydrogenase family n=1 Tax=Mesorhizobium muleiense TaxID=1004279 RepID=A0A1G8IKM8_9HYPH|nr:NAD(P)-dependent dehydrogenase, short-chain alcohol dehydrogenase family [Mesorhizobium muleiense]
MHMKSEIAGEAAKQRHIQRGIDAKDKAKGNGKQQRAMQAGARKYPEPPFPEQHQPKPGHEWAIEPAPLYDAPFYIGSKKLDGKVAVITGGDSGIGRAVAVLYAREGADVAIVYLCEDKDAEETKRAVEAEGRRCTLVKADVSERDHCHKAVTKVVKEFGRIDVLVNNAAFQVHSSDFSELTEEHFDTTLKTNLYGYFHMAQEAVPHMKPGSAIINSGSITGIEGSKQLVDYSMTKGGIHAFTRALSGNLIEKGIRVNCVAPGPVWTPLNPSDKQAGATFRDLAQTHR